MDSLVIWLRAFFGRMMWGQKKKKKRFLFLLLFIRLICPVGKARTKQAWDSSGSARSLALLRLRLKIDFVLESISTTQCSAAITCPRKQLEMAHVEDLKVLGSCRRSWSGHSHQDSV